MSYQIDPENPVMRCCAEGMEREASEGKTAAGALFLKAWDIAVSDAERCVAAHYLARAQDSIAAKLEWDRKALHYALNSSEDLRPMYPSLYLNIAKGLEDGNELQEAAAQYELALSYIPFLGEDGYGQMIAAGIRRGWERVKRK